MLPRRLVWLGLALQFALDAGVNVAPALHFQLADLEHEFGAAVHLHRLELLPLTLALVATCAAAALVAQALAGHTGRGPSLRLLGLTAVICAVDVCNGTSLLPLPVSRSFLDVNVANSASAKALVAWTVSASHQGPGSYEPLDASQSATGPLLAPIRDGSRPLPPLQLGLVTVESLGRLPDDEAMAQRLPPLTSPAIRTRCEVEVGAVPFHGVTLDGEFRELCGVRLGCHGSAVLDCLPAALARRGCQTVSLHGFTRAFYDRAVWCPGRLRPLAIRRGAARGRPLAHLRLGLPGALRRRRRPRDGPGTRAGLARCAGSTG